MMDLKTYGYTEIEAIPDGLLPGRVTELRRERFTIMTERGEITAVLKGAFFHSVETREDFPCVGDFVLLHYNECGDSLLVTVLPRRSKFSRADYSSTRGLETNDRRMEQANKEQRGMEQMNIKLETLIHALSQRFKTEIISADYQTTPLQGGTVGNVCLVTGIAETANSKKLPYRIVLKIQKKWERYGDPGSWRREYDLYASELGATFSDAFRWPTCYHTEINAEENEVQLWLEYIDGVTGLDLTGDMNEQVALELGRYQGKLYAEQPAVLHSLTNLSHADLMKNTYLHYRSWPVVYDYIRSEDCEFPQHVRQMLIDIDEHADEIFARIEKLPLVLCHRDFWVTNLIYSDGKIALIDWDTSGWGYLGEDLASLIADEADIDHMVEYYQRCVPAYYKGFSENTNISPIANHCVYEMILLVFGYRLVERYLHTEDKDEKTKSVHTLQKIYEMKTNPAQD